MSSALRANSRANLITVSRPMPVKRSCHAGVNERVLVVVARRVGALEAAAHAALGHQQVEGGGHQYLAVRGGDAPHRHAARTVGVAASGTPLAKSSNSTWTTASD